MLSLSSPSLFQNYFPQFYSYWGESFETQCGEQLWIYSNQTAKAGINPSCYQAIDCLLQHVIDEKGKLTLAVTSVVLGLTPTILSILGSSTGEMALLSCKRPLLSFMLSLGAPVIQPSRVFEQSDPHEFLRVPKAERWQPPKLATTENLVSLVEYTLSLAAIANVISVSLQLAFKSFPISTECDQRWEYLLWAYLPAVIHFLGLIAFTSRARWPNAMVLSDTSRSKLIVKLRWWFKDEFKPCRQRDRHPFRWHRESLSSILLSGLVAFLTMAHIIYGTAVLSSAILLGPADALGLMVQLAISAIVCRGVLMFELYGLRETTEILPANAALPSETDEA